MKLSKDLKLLEVFCICSGAMLAGVFVLPGLAYAMAGPALLISLFIAAIFAITGALSQAELVSAIPKAGGDQFYVMRCMGPMVGTVYGITTWISLSLKSAYALEAMAVFSQFVISVNIHLLAIILCSIFITLNFFGVKKAGRVQVYLVFGILITLLIYNIAHFPHVSVDRFQPFIHKGWGSIFKTASFVFVAFGGLLKIASMGEEVENPGKNIPIGMVLAVIIMTSVYLISAHVTIGILDPAILKGCLDPLSQGAEIAFGSAGKVILSVAAIIATISVTNAAIMSSSRYPLGLSRDNLLPSIFKKINKHNVPYVSLIATGIIIVLALFVDISLVIKAASTVLILTYIFANLSVIILRESKLQNYQPEFKAPLYPWVQIIGILGLGSLLFSMGQIAIIMTGALFSIGFFIYFIYGGPKEKKEYALLHLIERITAKELTTHSLESELKEIVRERDEIQKDRFDHLIEKCPILDVEGTVNKETFFKLAAQKMAKRLKISEEDLIRLFIKREEESTTVLTPDLAIPHIIIRGEKLFDILLVRSKEGIYFSEENPKIHTIFLLIGTKDERPFHLRALAAIAQIVQDENFEESWENAKSEEVLRDIILLGKRKRH